MSAAAPDLRIGGLVIMNHARLQITQSYRGLSRRADQRNAAGGGVRWTLWQGKIETTIDLVGWIPPGLAELDESAAMLVQCAAPRSVVSETNVIDLPAGRRTGGIYAPAGYAERAGELIETAVVMAGDQATLTPVAGADRYQAWYFPQLTGFVSIGEERTVGETAEHSVTITAQEV